MERLDGTLEKLDNNQSIIIKLNRICKDGKLYYKDTIKGENIFLMDIKNTDTIEFKDPKPDNRTFYEIESDGEKLILAERLVPLKNFCNFRDLGGYTTKDGRKVKWGLFYRSEELSNLTGKDLEYFKTLDIKYVLDYRSDSEEKKAKDVQVDGVKNIHISAMSSLDNDNLDMTQYVGEMLSGKSSSMTPKEILEEGYKDMPINNKAYKELMNLFKDPSNTAILQHCTAGKDRTGIGSALILLALGVDEETVIDDYLKSNDYRAKSNEKLLDMCKDYLKDDKMKNLIKDILGVDKEFLLLSIKTIKDKYSSFDEYFKFEYGLDEELMKKLRNEYLY